MFRQGMPIFFYTETCLHAGSEASLGHVDLPIQRNAVTCLPIVQASGIRGPIRALADPRSAEWIFGKSDRGGALSFTDAKLLLLPVASARGLFAWVTSPRVLAELRRDLSLIGCPPPEVGDLANHVPAVGTSCRLWVDPPAIEGNANEVRRGKVVLLDFSFGACPLRLVDNLWTWLLPALPKDDAVIQDGRLMVVDDDTFRDLTYLGSPVQTRIKINQDNGTVANGQLWTEECLPPEALLYSLCLATDPVAGKAKSAEPAPAAEPGDAPPREAVGAESVDSKKPPTKATDATGVLEEIRRLLADFTHLQLGGDDAVGHGFVRVLLPKWESPNSGNRSTTTITSETGQSAREGTEHA